MSTGFSFTATCPRCGGELLTDGLPSHHSPDMASHDARCDHCLDVYRVTVTTALVEAWPVDRCDPEARRAEACEAAALALHVASVG